MAKINLTSAGVKINGICKDNTYLLDEPEIIEIRKAWEEELQDILRGLDLNSFEVIDGVLRNEVVSLSKVKEIFKAYGIELVYPF